MSLWNTGEVPTSAKMNQKTVYIGASAPANPTDGQLWYDTSTKKLKVYDLATTTWKLTGRELEKGTLAERPAAGDAGRMYWATDTDEVYRDNGTAWEQVMHSVELKAGDYATALVGISGTATGRAALLDKLDDLISSRAAIADYTTARAAKLDNLDALISSRMPQTIPSQASPFTDYTSARAMALKTFASDTVRALNDAAKTTNVTAYTKKKEMLLNDALPDYFRTRFQLHVGSTGDTGYGRVYKNNVAVGTERSNNSTTYIEYTEDFNNWAANDLYQIYVYINNSLGTVYVNNQRLSYDYGARTTAQDPA
jgi:hypothetical protein